VRGSQGRNRRNRGPQPVARGAALYLAPGEYTGGRTSGRARRAQYASCAVVLAGARAPRRI
jgi:hypothetical protein